MQKFSFASLVDSLHFGTDFSKFSPMIQSHLLKVQDLLLEFLRTSNGIPQSVRESLAFLTETGYSRLVTSPYFCELLMLRKELADSSSQIKLEDQIITAIIAEIRVANPEIRFEIEPKWTINGDIVLDLDIAKEFPALQTSCGLQLNYQSQIHNTDRHDIGGYDHTIGLQHRERIETGRNLIQSTSPAADSLIENFTTMIQFRNNFERPNVVNSSTHTSIGLIRCDNFHKLHNDMPEIVDMLVHESIHQFLHLYEEQIEAFVDESKITPHLKHARLFASPWSGKPLDLRSYTHAILVWYGLIHFWQQYLDRNYEHRELTLIQAQEKLNEALLGFVNSSSVLDNLGMYAELLNPNYVEEVRRLQAGLQMKVGVA